MTAVIEVKNVSKTFLQGGALPWSTKTEVHAVRNVSLTVNQGDVIALVGQSGSGKTTLSRMILGLEEPTSGEIWLNQQRWDGLSEGERRKLGGDHTLANDAAGPGSFTPDGSRSWSRGERRRLRACDRSLCTCGDDGGNLESGGGVGGGAGRSHPHQPDSS